MADRPILFSGPMVRALLEGRKTQTRRVLSPQPPNAPDWRIADLDEDGVLWMGDRGTHCAARLRYALGDRLYVREAWRTLALHDAMAPSELAKGMTRVYEADGEHLDGWGSDVAQFPVHTPGKFRQGMHMPRWASRLTLIVTDVRVQRLQEISEDDAAAEGLISWQYQDCDGDPRLDGRPYTDTGWHWGAPQSEFDGFPTAIGAFRDLWDSLNADRGYGWEANPWCCAISFRVHRGNIDAMEVA